MWFAFLESVCWKLGPPGGGGRWCGTFWRYFPVGGPWLAGDRLSEGLKYFSSLLDILPIVINPKPAPPSSATSYVVMWHLLPPSLQLTFYMSSFLLFIMCACTCAFWAYMPRHTRGQRSAHGSWFSPSTMWVLVMELRLSVWGASTHWALLLDPSLRLLPPTMIWCMRKGPHQS